MATLDNSTNNHGYDDERGDYLVVNRDHLAYRYEIKDIEKNHEAYENDAVVTASRQVHALLKSKPERGRPEAGRFLALPGLRTVKSTAGTAESD